MGNTMPVASPTLTVMVIPGKTGGCDGTPPHCPPEAPYDLAPFVSKEEWAMYVVPALDPAIRRYPGMAHLRKMAGLFVFGFVCQMVGIATGMFYLGIAYIFPISYIIFIYQQNGAADSAVRVECQRLSQSFAARGVVFFLVAGGHKNKVRWLCVQHPAVQMLQPQPHQVVAMPPTSMQPFQVTGVPLPHQTAPNV
mmetsp:Transcript_9377/g.30953  ORF Transcript_9377/g.30953 Transcript_9377/m.30953 type:complete len:195 (-) Transcript_9377:907-1491(-)